jgi:hypothetical protein
MMAIARDGQIYSVPSRLFGNRSRRGAGDFVGLDGIGVVQTEFLFVVTTTGGVLDGR